MLILLENINSALAVTAIVLFLTWARTIVLPPSNFPKNIPTIPFYVTFVPIFTKWDQERIYKKFYREKMEKYGAAKVYFAARWNILISRPEFVLEVISQNEIFEKSGNQEKIPYAVISEYLGDNLISAGNANWAKYRAVAQDSIKFPDIEPLDGHVVNLLKNMLLQADEEGTLKVNRLFQKFALNCVGDCVIGCDFLKKQDGSSVHEKIIYLKTQIFKLLYMNFTFLDKFPIPSRIKAREAIREFKNYFIKKIVEEATDENCKKLGPKLATSFENGLITKKQFQDNAMIALIAGHENPQILLTTAVYLLAKHQQVQKKLREELKNLKSDTLDDCAYLNSVIYESLRILPPIGQLINRVTRKDVVLGGKILISKGIYVGNNSMFTQRDGKYWEKPDEFLPERWGTSVDEVANKYRTAKSKCTFTAFHGRKRACLGQKFALLEIRRAIAGILETYEFTLHPSWVERFTPSGPIWPVDLLITLKPLVEKVDSC